MKPQRRILLIDDTAEDRLTVRRFLQGDAEYQNVLVEATSAEAGLVACRDAAPDVVLLDYNLPRMDGLAVLEALRALPGWRTPVIFLTISGDGRLALKALERGAQDLLVKDDMTPTVLRRMIANAVAKEQLQRRLEQFTWRTARLQQVTAALSSAVTLQEVTEVILREGLEALGTDTGFVAFLSEDQQALEMQGRSGLSQEEVQPWLRIPLQVSVPVTDAVRTGELVVCCGLEERDARYPAFRGRSPRHTHLVAIPLRSGGRVLGALGLSFGHPCPLEPEDKEFFSTLAHQCAQALDRARLLAEVQRRAEFERQLIGIVSHDLKNPIGAILMQAQAARLYPGLDERTTQAFRRVCSAAERASRMVHDLLDFTQARLGSGIPLQPREVDLRQVATQVIEEASLAFPHRRVLLLDSPGDMRGRWDADRLAQFISNLVTNAVKYSPEETSPTVCLYDQGQEVSLEVHNQGPPIPPELLPRLFEPLHRVAPSTGKMDRSVGLGLYIVHHLVHAHGGRVSVRSSEEEGTTFTVHLPRHGMATQPSAAGLRGSAT
jgi:CheY-like chemotaxis protein/nitrogen-specific signal transduction histidine kinase